MEDFAGGAIEEAMKLTFQQDPAEATRVLLRGLSGGRLMNVNSAHGSRPGRWSSPVAV